MRPRSAKRRREAKEASSSLADHFESLSVSPPSTPPLIPGVSQASQNAPFTVRRSSRVASRNSSMIASPCKRSRVPRRRVKNLKRPRTKGHHSGGNVIESGSEEDPLVAIHRRGRRPRQIAEVPPLPGREQEFERIVEKIEEAIAIGQGCCICTLRCCLARHVYFGTDRHFRRSRDWQNCHSAPRH